MQTYIDLYLWCPGILSGYIISWHKSFKVSVYNSLTHELIKNIDIGYEFNWHGTNSMTVGQLHISPDGKLGFIQVRYGVKIINLEK
jgi:hypothetical protein